MMDFGDQTCYGWADCAYLGVSEGSKQVGEGLRVLGYVTSHFQDVAIDLFVSNVLHQPVQRILVSKVRDLSLQADERRQGALRLMFSEIIVWPEDYTAKHSIDALCGTKYLERERGVIRSELPVIHLLRLHMNICQRVC